MQFDPGNSVKSNISERFLARDMTSYRPLIGCTTYRKHIPQERPIDVFGLMPSYIDAIRSAGGLPVMIPLGLNDEELKGLFARLDGILLPGGGDVEPRIYHGRQDIAVWGIDPDRDSTEISLARMAVVEEKPILAICRGLQVFNVALGGTLLEDIKSLVPGSLNHDLPDEFPRNHLAHPVTTVDGSLVGRQLGKAESWVNSIHHQAIRDLAPDLSITATAPDGMIEAAEVSGHKFALGVQWHPESLVNDDPAMLNLFRGLVTASSNGHQQ